MPKKITRRGRGEGTIRKRTDGRWEGRVTIGVTTNGNSRTKSVYAPTRDECAKKMNAILAKFNTGRYIDATKSLMRDYMDEWLEHHHSLADNTRNTYQNYIRKYITPHLGGFKIAAITPIMLESWIKTLTKEGKGQRVIEQSFTIAKAALNRATEWGLLEQNPFTRVKRPPKSTTRRNVWTPQQAALVLETAQGTRLYAAFLLMLICGLRRGELLGLRWQDVDFATGKVRIQQTLIFLNGVRTFKPTPKTRAAERTFSLPTDVLQALQVRHGDTILERESAANKWIEHDLVFPYHDGTGLPEANLRRAIAEVCTRANVPRITPHEMRHTYTSLALLRKVDLKEVSRRLGHARVQTTLDIYQHLYPEQDTAAALSSADLLTPIKV